MLHRLVHLAVHHLGDNLRLADSQFKAFAAHLLHEDGQGELAAALDFPGIRTLGRKDLERDVADQFLVEAVLDLAGRDLGALDLAGQRGGVDTDGHGDRGIVHGDQRQRLGVVDVGQGFTNGDVLDTGNSHDFAGAGRLGRNALKCLGGEQLGDLHGLQGSVMAGPGNLLALAQGAVEDTQQGQAAQERGGVQVGDVRLQDTFRVVRGSRDVLEDGLEQRFQVVVRGSFAVGGLLQGRGAHTGCSVDNGNVQDQVKVQVRNFVREVGGQAQEQVHGFADNLVDPGIGAVGLVDQQDHRQLGGQCLAQHEAGLRQGAFRGVHQQHNAVDHGQAALDLTAEVGVAGGVDDVDGDGLAVGRRAVVEHRGVLREDGNTLFALQVTGVHHAFFHVSVGGKRVRLLQHGVDEGRLTVVNVGHNSNVAEIASHCAVYSRVGF